jgi:hypothetical protein
MTGSQLEIQQCQSAGGAVQASIAEYQAGALAQQMVTAAPESEVPAQAPADTGLLGDLPSLQKTGMGSPDKGGKKKIKIRRNLVSDCPDEFRCQIDHKILTKPIRAPDGSVFEEKTLEQWMQTCGSINPINNEHLTMEMCVFDKELQKKIVKWFKENQ